MVKARQAGRIRQGGQQEDTIPRASTCEPPEFPGGTLSEFSGLGIPVKTTQSYGGNQVMFRQASIRIEQISSIGRGLQYLIGCCSVPLAIVSVVIGIEVSVATASSGTAPSVEIMDRARKGDRLPLVPALHRNDVNRPPEIKVLRISAHDQDLAEGCESLASPLARSPAADIAGRCLC